MRKRFFNHSVLIVRFLFLFHMKLEVGSVYPLKTHKRGDGMFRQVGGRSVGYSMALWMAVKSRIIVHRHT